VFSFKSEEQSYDYRESWLNAGAAILCDTSDFGFRDFCGRCIGGAGAISWWFKLAAEPP
jgi:hypothetical protein